MLQTAQKTDPSHFGRHGNESATRPLAHLPDDFHEGVSHSLDYSSDFFALLPLPNNWVQTETATRYTASSLSYRTLYDAQTGFMRARSTNGTLKEPSLLPAGEEIMQNALPPQATFCWALRPLGLIELMGGEKAFTQRLLDQPIKTSVVRGYGLWNPWNEWNGPSSIGQIAISINPAHIPYLFRYSLHPEYTNLLIQQIPQVFHQDFQAFRWWGQW